MLVMISTVAAVLFSGQGQTAFKELQTKSPHTMIRYAQRRLEGHEALQWLLLPSLHALQARFERTPPAGPLSTLGKGQQMVPMQLPTAEDARMIRVETAADLAAALLTAVPGTHIVVAPGQYRFDKTLRLGHNGLALAPIRMSAIVPGSVRLEFSQEEGILIDRPHWIFESLDIRGTCAEHRSCEHAFHVVGAAAFTTLRNNYLQDFNAHIKINGEGREWPDHGLIAFNTLTNTVERQTNRPVVTIDLVGASHWKVQDNLITSFAKLGGHGVAYGVFMKGASEGGRIERNLVICSPTRISGPGERVGISFGGGRTDPGVCRTSGCQFYEHRQGLAANNIVAHCNDAGVDINSATQITLAHNTLINTAGFSIRGDSSQVKLLGNLYEGNISSTTEASPSELLNIEAATSAIFVSPDALLLQWLKPPEPIPLQSFVTIDFSGRPRQRGTLPGALEGMSP